MAISSGFDQLWAWVDSTTGEWCIDMNRHTIYNLQNLTYMRLCEERGLSYFDDNTDLDFLIQDTGWIKEAKRFGIIRLRTKQERESHNKSVIQSLNEIDGDTLPQNSLAVDTAL